MAPAAEKTMLVIPHELMRRARIKALERRTNVSAVVRELLEKWIEEEPPSTETEKEPEQLKPKRQKRDS